METGVLYKSVVVFCAFNEACLRVEDRVARSDVPSLVLATAVMLREVLRVIVPSERIRECDERGIRVGVEEAARVVVANTRKEVVLL